MALPDDDQVRFDILIEAQAAIKSLQVLLRGTEDNRQKIIEFTKVVIAQSRLWGISWQQALNVYKQLNAELSKNKKPNLFGNVGGQDLFKQSEQYMQSLDQANRLQEKVGESGKQMGDKIEQGTRKATGGLHLVRIALGALEAMLIFRIVAAIENTFRMMIGNLREAELAVYNLINAERRLSEDGIDVTPKGLQETIDAVRELVPVLSQIQAEELVSRIATNVAPALKLTNTQIRQLAESTALLYVRNKALGKSFDEVESQLTNAFLTGKVSQGINNLGVKITDQIVRDEALRMGLVKTAEEFNNLSGEMEAQIKASAMLSVVYKNATQDVESLGEYMETTDAAISEAGVAWNDLLTIVGTYAGPVLIKVFKGISMVLGAWVEIFILLKPIMVDFFATLVAWIEVAEYKLTHPLAGLAELALKFSEFKNTAIEKSMESLATAADTATANVEDLHDALNSTFEDAEEFGNKIEDILSDAENAREDLATHLAQKQEDLALQFNQKLEDLELEYIRKAEDAAQDYANTVEDINLDAQQAVADAQQDAQMDEQRREEEHLLALKHLREDYLLSLEDALHSRDARQVLRLMKQYNLDKQQLIDKYELDKKFREEALQAELERIEQERVQRLEEARREYQQKLEDLKIAKARELETLNTWMAREQADLQTWYAREQEEIEKNVQRKLETLIKGYIDEQKITEANAAAVYGILYRYFGPGGMTDNLYQYMMASLAQATAQAQMMAQGYGQLGGGFGGGSNTEIIGGNAAGSSGGGNHGGRNRFAEGGMLLATRPTNAMFGESGPELVTFTPIGRVGRNQGKVFGGESGAGGMDGKIVLDLFLSPDLEARVIENSMNGVAEVVTRINRSKV